MEKQNQYKTTIFKVHYDRTKKTFMHEEPKPPPGSGWTMVNFHPVGGSDNMATYFVAVWTKEELTEWQTNSTQLNSGNVKNVKSIPT